MMNPPSARITDLLRRSRTEYCAALPPTDHVSLMSKGPADSATEAHDAPSPSVSSSAVVVGRARVGDGALLAEGAVIRARDMAVAVGTGSAVLENSVVVGTAAMPTVIG